MLLIVKMYTHLKMIGKENNRLTWKSFKKYFFLQLKDFEE